MLPPDVRSKRMNIISSCLEESASTTPTLLIPAPFYPPRNIPEQKKQKQKQQLSPKRKAQSRQINSRDIRTKTAKERLREGFSALAHVHDVVKASIAESASGEALVGGTTLQQLLSLAGAAPLRKTAPEADVAPG